MLILGRPLIKRSIEISGVRTSRACDADFGMVILVFTFHAAHEATGDVT
jgi:hypothetical protein